MQEKILDLGWSILAHSTDFASSDYLCFCSLQKVLNDTKFSQQVYMETFVKMFVENFLISKPAEFYLGGINKLFDKSQKVI